MIDSNKTVQVMMKEVFKVIAVRYNEETELLCERDTMAEAEQIVRDTFETQVGDELDTRYSIYEYRIEKVYRVLTNRQV